MFIRRDGNSFHTLGIFVGLNVGEHIPMREKCVYKKVYGFLIDSSCGLEYMIEFLYLYGIRSKYIHSYIILESLFEYKRLAALTPD